MWPWLIFFQPFSFSGAPYSVELWLIVIPSLAERCKYVMSFFQAHFALRGFSDHSLKKYQPFVFYCNGLFLADYLLWRTVWTVSQNWCVRCNCIPPLQNSSYKAFTRIFMGSDSQKKAHPVLIYALAHKNKNWELPLPNSSWEIPVFQRADRACDAAGPDTQQTAEELEGRKDPSLLICPLSQWL